MELKELTRAELIEMSLNSLDSSEKFANKWLKEYEDKEDKENYGFMINYHKNQLKMIAFIRETLEGLK